LAILIAMLVPQPPRLFDLLPAALLVTLPDFRNNTASLLSGTALFLAWFQTWRLEAEPARKWCTLGLLIGAVATLRQNFLPVGFLATLFAWGLTARAGRRRVRWQTTLNQPLIATAAGLVVMAPWALATWRSEGTPLFPLLPGNGRGDAVLSSHLTAIQLVALAVDHGFLLWPIVTLPAFVLAAFGVARDDRPALLALIAASAVGIGGLVAGFGTAHVNGTGRYYLPFTLASTLAVSIAARRVPTRSLATLLVVGATLVQLSQVWKDFKDRTHHELDVLHGAMPNFEPSRARYDAMQSTLAPGATVLAMLKEPFLLDFRRNTIFIVDLPGLVSPAPGLHTMHSAKDAARYLRGIGIRYFAYGIEEQTTELYRRATWRERAREQSDLLHVMGTDLPLMGKRIMPVLDVLYDMGQSFSPVFDDGTLRVIDLEAPIVRDAPLSENRAMSPALGPTLGRSL
jgi:hypothetical protein